MLNGARRIPVLMYHRIGSSANAQSNIYSVSPERFRRHMNRLAAQGMQPCSLEDFLAWLADDTDLPEGSFLLTFDDGFLGVHDHAAPVLHDLGWPATVFLVSQLIGKESTWCLDNNHACSTDRLMAREHILAMRETGFTFQSHSRLHPDLTTLSEDTLEQELSGSRHELEELLQEQVTCLAYPYGRHDERVIAAAINAGYRAAFSTLPGFNDRHVDAYRIRRLDIFGNDTPGMLLRKVVFGSNDGSWMQTMRYYGKRLRRHTGL